MSAPTRYAVTIEPDEEFPTTWEFTDPDRMVNVVLWMIENLPTEMDQANARIALRMALR